MQAVSCESSNYRQIVANIETIATTLCGLSFAGSKRYEHPYPDEIDAAGQPYFVVRMGHLAGFAIGGVLHGADAGERLPETTEPVWDFECYSLYSTTRQAPNYDAAAQALVSLMQGFMVQWTLLDSCAVANPHSPDMVYVEIGGTSYIAAKFVIRVYEQLQIEYS